MAQEEDGAAAAASGTKPALDIEIVIEHRHKNHPLKFAKLMNTYFEANVELRRLAFYWL